MADKYIIVQLLKNKDGVTVGQKFYAGTSYLPNKAPNGLLWTDDRQLAYEFEEKENANNFLGGSGKDMAGCVIQPKVMS